MTLYHKVKNDTRSIAKSSDVSAKKCLRCKLPRHRHPTTRRLSPHITSIHSSIIFDNHQYRIGCCCASAFLSLLRTSFTFTSLFLFILFRMASTARRAVRFFGTVHAQVDSVRNKGANLFTPERFPAVLAATCVTGLIVGWQIMDRIQDESVWLSTLSVSLLAGDTFSVLC